MIERGFCVYLMSWGDVRYTQNWLSSPFR